MTGANTNNKKPMSASGFPPLTRKQIFELTKGDRYWWEKREHLIRLAGCFGIVIKTDGELKNLIEVHCLNEARRIRKKDIKNGRSKKTNLIPTDKRGGFAKVGKPVVGYKYHISWAFSGAVFKLVKIDGDVCYLDNPKYKREKLLECKVSELRGLR